MGIPSQHAERGFFLNIFTLIFSLIFHAKIPNLSLLLFYFVFFAKCWLPLRDVLDNLVVVLTIAKEMFT